jgi:hypothetical protein
MLAHEFNGKLGNVAASGSDVGSAVFRAPNPQSSTLWTSPGFPDSRLHSNLTSLASCISPHWLVVVCSFPLPSSKIEISKTRRASLQSQPTAGDVGDKSNTESMPVPSKGMTFSPSVVLSCFSFFLCSGLKVVALP